MTIRHPIRPHLRAWREKIGHKQNWLAGQLGIHPSNVLRQERGDIGVDDDTFASIAKAYCITVEELSVHPDEAEKAKQIHRLLAAVERIDSEAVAALAIMAERMARP